MVSIPRKAVGTGLIVLILLAGWGFTAHGQKQHENKTEEKKVESIKEIVRAELKDPYSAVFSGIVIINHSDGSRACGFVNAKNAYGGYAGRLPFAVILKGENAMTAFVAKGPDDSFVNSFCEPVWKAASDPAFKNKSIIP